MFNSDLNKLFLKFQILSASTVLKSRIRQAQPHLLGKKLGPSHVSHVLNSYCSPFTYIGDGTERRIRVKGDELEVLGERFLHQKSL